MEAEFKVKHYIKYTLSILEDTLVYCLKGLSEKSILQIKPKENGIKQKKNKFAKSLRVLSAIKKSVREKFLSEQIQLCQPKLTCLVFKYNSLESEPQLELSLNSVVNFLWARGLGGGLLVHTCA